MPTTDADRAAYLQANRVELTQAERVVTKMGGPYRLAKLIDYDPSAVYRWFYPKEEKGTGGLIPNRALRRILKAAREQGIFLTADDLFPGRS